MVGIITYVLIAILAGGYFGQKNLNKGMDAVLSIYWGILCGLFWPLTLMINLGRWLGNGD